MVLVDGAETQLDLVEAGAAEFGVEVTVVLDIIHVVEYVWKAAHVFHREGSPELQYDRYLAAGYPIATGVVEGACRYLVRDRMELTGARWRLVGAEAVLKLRALRASGDFDAYWTFHEAREYERNHAQRYADGIVPPVADPPPPPSDVAKSACASHAITTILTSLRRPAAPSPPGVFRTHRCKRTWRSPMSLNPHASSHAITTILTSLDGRQRLLFLVLLTVGFFVVLAYLVSDDVVFTWLVACLLFAVIWITRHVWRPDDYGRNSLRRWSLILLFAAYQSHPFWHSAIDSLIPSLEFLPRSFSALFHALPSAPSAAAQLTITLAVFFVNYWVRDKTAMTEHRADSPPEFTESQLRRKLSIVGNVLLATSTT